LISQWYVDFRRPYSMCSAASFLGEGASGSGCKGVPALSSVTAVTTCSQNGWRQRGNRLVSAAAVTGGGAASAADAHLFGFCQREGVAAGWEAILRVAGRQRRRHGGARGWEDETAVPRRAWLSHRWCRRARGWFPRTFRRRVVIAG